MNFLNTNNTNFPKKKKGKTWQNKTRKSIKSDFKKIKTKSLSLEKKETILIGIQNKLDNLGSKDIRYQNLISEYQIELKYLEEEKQKNCERIEFETFKGIFHFITLDNALDAFEFSKNLFETHSPTHYSLEDSTLSPIKEIDSLSMLKSDISLKTDIFLNEDLVTLFENEELKDPFLEKKIKEIKEKEKLNLNEPSGFSHFKIDKILPQNNKEKSEIIIKSKEQDPNFKVDISKVRIESKETPKGPKFFIKESQNIQQQFLNLKLSNGLSDDIKNKLHQLEETIINLNTKVLENFQGIDAEDLIYSMSKYTTGYNTISNILKDNGLKKMIPSSKMIAETKENLKKDLYKQLNVIVNNDNQVYTSIKDVSKILIDGNGSNNMLKNNFILYKLNEDDKPGKYGTKLVKITSLSFANCGSQIVHNNHILYCGNPGISHQSFLDKIKLEIEELNANPFEYRGIQFQILCLYSGDWKNLADLSKLCESHGISKNLFCLFCNITHEERMNTDTSDFKEIINNILQEFRNITLNLGIKTLFISLCILHCKLRSLECLLKNILLSNYFIKNDFKKFLNDHDVYIKEAKQMNVSNDQDVDKLSLKGSSFYAILEDIIPLINEECSNFEKEIKNQSQILAKISQKDDLLLIISNYKNLISFLELPNDLLQNICQKKENRKTFAEILGNKYISSFTNFFKTLSSFSYYMHFMICSIPSQIKNFGSLTLLSTEGVENNHQFIQSIYDNLVILGTKNEEKNWSPCEQIFFWSWIKTFIEVRRSLRYSNYTGKFYLPPSISFLKDDNEKLKMVEEILTKTNPLESRHDNLYNISLIRSRGKETKSYQKEMKKKEEKIKFLSNIKPLSSEEISQYNFKEVLIKYNEIKITSKKNGSLFQKSSTYGSYFETPFYRNKLKNYIPYDLILKEPIFIIDDLNNNTTDIMIKDYKNFKNHLSFERSNQDIFKKRSYNNDSNNLEFKPKKPTFEKDLFIKSIVNCEENVEKDIEDLNNLKENSTLTFLKIKINALKNNNSIHESVVQIIINDFLNNTLSKNITSLDLFELTKYSKFKTLDFPNKIFNQNVLDYYGILCYKNHFINIFINLNLNSHIIFCTILDSMNIANLEDKELQTLKESILININLIYKRDFSIDFKIINTNRQSNNLNCGLYCLMSIYENLNNISEMKFNGIKFRNGIIKYLLKKFYNNGMNEIFNYSSL